MGYTKFSGETPSPLTISKISLVFSVISFFLCGGLIYKIYDLQIQISQLEKTFQLQENALKAFKELAFDDWEQDSLTVSNHSDSFQWNTGTSNLLYHDDDIDDVNDSEYEDYDITSQYDVATKKIRSKREVLMTTLDGVPVNSESYENTKKENKTSINVSTVPPSSSGTYVRKSRVMRVDDKSKAFRTVMKRPLVKSSDSVREEELVRQIPHRRRHRQRRVESEERFFRPAIHLSGDVYASNGWSHHEADHYRNWSRENWVKTLGMDQYFFLDDGYLRITEPGLYLIYAQVLYFDEHDTNGFYVYNNHDIILQCTTTSHSNHRVRKSNTCYTAGINYLNHGDRLRVHDIESYRYSIFRPGKSFFGAIKLSDVRRNL